MKEPAKWRGGLEDALGYERIEWKKRLVAMAKYINADDMVIMDLGAGNMHLRGLLKPEQKYVPVDYKKNAEDTIVCDFNKGEFPDVKADAIVAAGILEYMKNPIWFLDKMCEASDKCIVSYKGNEKYPDSILSTDEIIEHMKENGFVLTGKEESLAEWTLIGCFEKLIPDKMGKQLYCTGCGACANACPSNALKIVMDERGFYKPQYQVQNCVNCGKCINVCPLGDRKVKNNNKETPTAYAVWAEDEIRMKSSSGGVFYQLASYVIERSGIVFGVRWDEKFVAITDCTDNIEELPLYMHSKYVQSRVGMAYTKTKEYLEEGRMVLFVGTPCQIAGLKSYLGEIWNNQCLYTVDLVCFGVPSNGIFQKYLEENYSIDNIRNITFREKEIRGWSPTGYKIEIQNGDCLFREMKDDCYQQLFHGVLFRNETCEKCEYYKIPRIGDLTIGDFWGIDIHDRTWNDGKGTSLVLLNSSKAEKLWGDLSDRFKRAEEVPLDWCANKGNRVMTNARNSNPNKEFFNELMRSKSFNYAVENAISDHHDVGIVCMMNYNIGNNLTNYALYSVVKKLGYSVKMIDMPSEVKESQCYLEKGAMYYFLKNPYNSADYLKSKNKYELYKYSDKCDIFMVGSDQLWRDIFAVAGTEYFTALNWVPSYKYMFSYATSTGTGNFDASPHQIQEMKFLLGRFNRLSVREKSGQNLLKKWGLSARVVLDPVFLCDRNIYDELAGIGGLRVPKEKYVAAYLLDVSEEKEKIVQTVTKMLSEDRYVAMTEPTHSKVEGHLLDYTLEPCIEEWVSMIKNSEFVITDSFHGMCFALIYEKPFFVVFNPSCWRGYERFVDLLSLLGIEDRILKKGCEVTAENLKINYDLVNSKISELKKESKMWLEAALLEGKQYVGEMGTYDYYLESEYQRYIHDAHIREKIKQIQSNAFFQKNTKLRKKNNRKKSDKKMVVIGWGAGNCFRNHLDSITKYSEMKYVCDSNPNLWGTRLTKEIVCISPSELLKFDNVMILIMVENAGAAVTIANTLLDMGISNFEHIGNWIKEIEGIDNV
ncbi:MAG: polysaccharide pyruvyl transferase family protein [Lachnospiraceae bacterium]